jgi:hypothetical protein
MSLIKSGEASLTLGSAALILSALSLLFDQGYSALVSSAPLGWTIDLILLGGCLLVIVAAVMEPVLWPYLFYMAEILFVPTMLGFSQANWFAWFDTPSLMSVFRSSLPDIVCLIIGVFIVTAHIVGQGAERLQWIVRELNIPKAHRLQVDLAADRAFAHMAKRVAALAAAIVVVWVLGTALATLPEITAVFFSGSYLVVGLVAAVALIVLFYRLVRKNPGEGDPGL